MKTGSLRDLIQWDTPPGTGARADRFGACLSRAKRYRSPVPGVAKAVSPTSLWRDGPSGVRVAGVRYRGRSDLDVGGVDSEPGSEQVGAASRETEVVELVGETSGGIGILSNVNRVCRVSSTDRAARLNERVGDLGEDGVEFPGLLGWKTDGAQIGKGMLEHVEGAVERCDKAVLCRSGGDVFQLPMRVGADLISSNHGVVRRRRLAVVAGPTHHAEDGNRHDSDLLDQVAELGITGLRGRHRCQREREVRGVLRHWALLAHPTVA